MRYRRLGKTDLSVSEVGFGCARLGGVFQGSSQPDILRLLQRSFELGITFFDTADMYTQGESERLLGEAFRNHRHEVVLATKVGYKLPTQKRLISRLKPLIKPLVTRLGLRVQRVPASLRGAVSEQDFTAGYITTAIEASLRRLKTDYIDIYQLHSPPPNVLRRGLFVPVLEQLQRQGKIRHWGVACERAEDALVCLEYPTISSIQVALSYLEPRALEAAIPRAAERGVGIIARQVFASGLLTKPVETTRLDQLDADPGTAERKRAVLATFEQEAQQAHRSRGELALEFVLGHGEVSVALLGMHRADHLSANLDALRGVSCASWPRPAAD